MGEILNLRQARKRAERRKSEATAASNRVAFGTPKSLRDEARRERSQSLANLDAHRIEQPTRHLPGNTDPQSGSMQGCMMASPSDGRGLQDEGSSLGHDNTPGDRA